MLKLSQEYERLQQALEERMEEWGKSVGRVGRGDVDRKPQLALTGSATGSSPLYFHNCGQAPITMQHGDNAAQPAADNGSRQTKSLRHHPGLDFPQLRPAGKENLVDADHAPADVIGRLQLADGVAQDGADRIRRADKDQRKEGQEEAAAQAKQNGGKAKGSHRAEQQLALPADVGALREEQRHRTAPMRLAGRQPAVLQHAYLEDLLRDKWQQRVGRGEKGGEEIQDHAGENDGRMQDKAHALPDGLAG